MGGVQLITGGSGYFGSLLRDVLVARGERVRVLDRVDASDRPVSVEFVQADIRDADAVRAACEGVDAVFHNVALVPLAKDREAFWSVNHGGTRVLLEACVARGVRKLVNTSSSAVFGIPERNPVDEETPPRPVEEYGRAKLAGEQLALRFAEETGLEVAVVRPRTVLGHGRLGIFQILFDWVSEGRRIPVLGRGDNLYQFVHAEDLAEVCIRAAARPGTRIYHAGATRFGTMREGLTALCEHAGTGSRVVSFPMPLAVAGMQLTSRLGLSPLAPYHWLLYGRSLYFDPRRMREELGYEPRYSNAEMLCESYDWYLAHREEVKAGSGASPHRSALRQGVLGWLRRLL